MKTIDYIGTALVTAYCIMLYLCQSAINWFDSLKAEHVLGTVLSFCVCCGLLVYGLPFLVYLCIHSCVTLPLWYLMETA